MEKTTLETKVSELVEMFGTPKQIWEQWESLSKDRQNQCDGIIKGAMDFLTEKY